MRNKNRFKLSPYSLSLSKVRLLLAMTVVMTEMKSQDEKKINASIGQAIEILENKAGLHPLLNNNDIDRLLKQYAEEWEKYANVRKISELVSQTIYMQTERRLKRELQNVNKDNYLYYFFNNPNVSKKLEEKAFLIREFASPSLKLLFIHKLSVKNNDNTIKKLAAILKYMPSDLYARIQNNDFIVFGKHIDDVQAKEIRKLKRPGFLIEEKKRMLIDSLKYDLKKEWNLYVKMGIIVHAEPSENRFFVNTGWPSELKPVQAGEVLRYYPFISDAIADARKTAMPQIKMDDVVNFDMLYQFIRFTGVLKVENEIFYPKDIIISIDDSIKKRASINKSTLKSFKNTPLEGLWKKIGELMMDIDKDSMYDMSDFITMSPEEEMIDELLEEAKSDNITKKEPPVESKEEISYNLTDMITMSVDDDDEEGSEESSSNLEKTKSLKIVNQKQGVQEEVKKAIRYSRLKEQLRHKSLSKYIPCPYPDCRKYIEIYKDWKCAYCRKKQDREQYITEKCLHCQEERDVYTCDNCNREFYL